MNIQVYGYMCHQGSVPKITSAWIDNFIQNGHNVKFFDYSSVACSEPKYRSILGLHNPASNLAFYFGSPSNMHFSGELLKGHKYKVGVYVSELDLSAKEKYWLDNTKHTLIVTPSNYCNLIFKHGITNYTPQFMIVHHGIDSEYGIIDTPKFEKFTYLYIFYNSPTGGTHIRKNLIELLKAFKTLRSCIDVRLYVKTSSNIQIDLKQLSSEYDPTGSVIFDILHPSTQEICTLYNKSHIYINPSRAEGFGSCPLEAMACGLPVVSTIHTGLAEYLSPDNCVEIPSKKGNEPFKYATNYGCLRDVLNNDIYEKMRFAYDNYKNLNIKSLSMASSVKGGYNWNNCLREINDWINRCH